MRLIDLPKELIWTIAHVAVTEGSESENLSTARILNATHWLFAEVALRKSYHKADFYSAERGQTFLEVLKGNKTLGDYVVVLFIAYSSTVSAGSMGNTGRPIQSYDLIRLFPKLEMLVDDTKINHSKVLSHLAKNNSPYLHYKPGSLPGTLTHLSCDIEALIPMAAPLVTESGFSRPYREDRVRLSRKEWIETSFTANGLTHLSLFNAILTIKEFWKWVNQSGLHHLTHLFYDDDNFIRLENLNKRYIEDTVEGLKLNSGLKICVMQTSVSKKTQDRISRLATADLTWKLAFGREDRRFVFALHRIRRSLAQAILSDGYWSQVFCEEKNPYSEDNKPNETVWDRAKKVIEQRESLPNILNGIEEINESFVNMKIPKK